MAIALPMVRKPFPVFVLESPLGLVICCFRIDYDRAIVNVASVVTRHVRSQARVFDVQLLAGML
jgi:hypothetical protein